MVETSEYILITGPLLVGALVANFLFGIYIQQLYYYYQTYWGKDRRLLIGLVVFMTAIEITQMVIIIHVTFAILAAGFANPEVLLHTSSSSSVLPAMNGLVALCVQFLFGWRVYKLSKTILGKVLASSIFLASAAQCIAAIAVTVQFIMSEFHTVHLIRLKIGTIIWVGGAAVCDVLITFGIIISLLAGMQSKIKASRSMVNAIIANTIENMAVTSVCAVVDLALYIRYPDSFLTICMMFITSRLYANVLLTSLNSRHRIRDNAEKITFRTNEEQYEPGSMSFKIPGNLDSDSRNCATTVDDDALPMAPRNTQPKDGPSDHRYMSHNGPEREV